MVSPAIPTLGHRSSVTRIDTFVRRAEEVVALARAKILPEERKGRITIHVGFMHAPLATVVARKFAAVRTPENEFRVKGREYFWLCRGRTSDWKVWTSPQIKSLRLPTSSMRNLTSIRKLLAKHLS
jgi:uncharacterized protein (DUF1697 family)